MLALVFFIQLIEILLVFLLLYRPVVLVFSVRYLFHQHLVLN